MFAPIMKSTIPREAFLGAIEAEKDVLWLMEEFELV
jgi:hypothetical protein